MHDKPQEMITMCPGNRRAACLRIYLLACTHYLPSYLSAYFIYLPASNFTYMLPCLLASPSNTCFSFFSSASLPTCLLLLTSPPPYLPWSACRPASTLTYLPFSLHTCSFPIHLPVCMSASLIANSTSRLSVCTCLLPSLSVSQPVYSIRVTTILSLFPSVCLPASLYVPVYIRLCL